MHSGESPQSAAVGQRHLTVQCRPRQVQRHLLIPFDERSVHRRQARGCIKRICTRLRQREGNSRQGPVIRIGCRISAGARFRRSRSKSVASSGGWHQAVAKAEQIRRDHYWRIDFVGTTTGNVRDRSSTFNDRIVVVYGPVKHPSDVIDPANLPATGLPKNGGIMRCRKLQVTQHKKTPDQDEYVELLADGNAKLEGQRFHGRADRIIYDESKEQYTLHSWAPRMATLWMQESIGGDYVPNVSQSITFKPKHHELHIHRGTVFGGVQ